MHIALEDGFSIQKGTGIGQHTLNLYHQLQFYPEIESVELIPKPLISNIHPPFVRRAFYAVWVNTILPIYLRKRKIDVIHFTNNLIPRCRSSNIKYVVTIHDMTPWQFPGTLPNRYLSYIKRAITHAVMNSDLILTVSKTIKDELISILNIEHKKIHVAYNGIAHDFWRVSTKTLDEINHLKSKFHLKKNFILCVGVIEERKNIFTLLNAFEKIKKYKDIQLVLVGRPGFGYTKIKQRMNNILDKDDIISTGYVTLNELIGMYDAASIFIYPSLYEGFGIPLLEAMVRGTPIVASKIPTTLEIAGDAALYFDNADDDNALVDCIIKIIEQKSIRDTLIKRGKEQIRNFSWDKVGRMYLNAYQSLFNH